MFRDTIESMSWTGIKIFHIVSCLFWCTFHGNCHQSIQDVRFFIEYDVTHNTAAAIGQYCGLGGAKHLTPRPAGMAMANITIATTADVVISFVTRFRRINVTVVMTTAKTVTTWSDISARCFYSTTK